MAHQASRRWVAVVGLTVCFTSASALAATPGVGGPPVRPKDGWDPWACSEPITDLLVEDGIDFGQRGFSLRTPGDGYDLQAFFVQAYPQCGNPASGALQASSSWFRSTGEPVGITQTTAAEPVPMVIEWGSASFSDDGYAFAVWTPYALPPDGGGVLSSAAATPSRSPLAARAAAGPLAQIERVAVRRAAESAPTPPPAMRAWAAKVADEAGLSRPVEPVASAARKDGSELDLVTEVVGRLAPSVDITCFHRRVTGDWEDLPDLALGDPREGLPDGFEVDAAYFDLSYLQHPSETCLGPAPPTRDGVILSVSLSNTGGGWAGLFVVSRDPQVPAGPGLIDDYGVSWSNDRYSYWASLWPNGAPGRSALETLAKTVDPTFSSECLLSPRYLLRREARALGFRLPKAPPGYHQVTGTLYAQLPSASCKNPSAGYFSFSWLFDAGDRSISAALYRPVPGGPIAPDPTLNPISWIDDEATSFWVYGWTHDPADTIDQSELVAVARSLDPSAFP